MGRSAISTTLSWNPQARVRARYITGTVHFYTESFIKLERCFRQDAFYTEIPSLIKQKEKTMNHGLSFFFMELTFEASSGDA